jgi:hypothetical protein
VERQIKTQSYLKFALAHVGTASVNNPNKIVLENPFNFMLILSMPLACYLKRLDCFKKKKSNQF